MLVRLPAHDAVERIHEVPFAALERDYLSVHRPVVLTDLTARWRATRRWSPDFFRKRYGSRLVEVYDESFQRAGASYLKSSGTMRFGDFIELIHAGPTPKRLFLFELFRMAPELRADIELPDWVDSLSRRFLVTFFGGEGGTTTFHYDVDLPHVFHAVLYGQKDFHLFAPDQTPLLYRHPFTVRSYVDARSPDLQTYPRFALARGARCTVTAGETLVIPSGQWHQVHYDGPSWGIAFRKYQPRHVPRGLYNMVVQESVDKALTRLAPGRWTRWKQARAQRRSTQA